MLTLVTLGVAIGLEIWRFDHHAQIISGALVIDDLALILDLIFCSLGVRRRAAVVARGGTS